MQGKGRGGSCREEEREGAKEEGKREREREREREEAYFEHDAFGGGCVDFGDACGASWGVGAKGRV